MREENRDDLSEILAPRSIAIIGASPRPYKSGERALRAAISGGFPGPIYPINPRYRTVLGRTAYATIADVPDPKPELAFVLIPARQVIGAVRQCAEAGVRCCVIESAGFAESGGEGLKLEEELVAVCQETGIRVVGPNCLGMIVPPARLILEAGATLFERTLDGSIALVCQSGSLMMHMYHRGVELGFGFRCCVSVGNQADLDVSDFVAHFAQDPRTSVVCAYVEGTKNPKALLRAAQDCRRMHKTLIVLKAGRSAEGAAVASSHTASLVGSAAAFEALCLRAGALVVDDPDTMIALAGAVTRWPLPANKSVAVLSGSGGGAAVLADRVRAAEVEIAPLGAPQQARLSSLVLPVAGSQAIVDLGRRVDVGTDDYACQVAETILADPNVGTGIFALTVTGRLYETARQVAEAASRSGKLLIVTMYPGAYVAEATSVLTAAGCPCVATTDEGVRLLLAWLARRDVLDERTGIQPDEAEPRHRDRGQLPSLPAGRLSEIETKELLHSRGIAITAGTVAASAAEAVEASKALGFPVALKVVSKDVVHKTELGGVALNLACAADVRAAWEQIVVSVRGEMPNATLDGCYVQEMTDHNLELLIGVRRDEQFGAVIVLGSGGILAEVVKDIQIATAPISRATALTLLKRLRVGPTLFGTTRKRRADIEAIVDTIVAVGELGAELGDRLIDLEINPLAVWLGRAGVKVLDARATLST